RQPAFLIRGDEVRGAGRADDVADGALAIVQHVGVLWLQEQVRPGEGIGDQVIGAVPAAHAPARVRGLHTDLLHGGLGTGTVTAGRSGQALSLLSWPCRSDGTPGDAHADRAVKSQSPRTGGRGNTTRWRRLGPSVALAFPDAQQRVRDRHARHHRTIIRPALGPELVDT